MTKYFALAFALVLFSACDANDVEEGEETGLTIADVQGEWQKTGDAFERVRISGTTFEGGDTADLCFAPTYEATLSASADGGLDVTTASDNGTVSLDGDRLVVSGTVDAFFYDYNGRYTRADSDLADC
jgi:hypothetical protein